MSTILREVAVALGLEVDSASFAEGELAAKALEKGLEGIVEVAKKTIEFFVDVAKEAVLATDEIDKNAQAVGLTTAAYQELTYVGGLAGVSAEEMAQSFGLLSRNLYAASKGGEEQAKVFAQLGIHVKGADGKLRGADDVLGDIAEKFQKMPDGAQKTALALELFGRAGKRMIPLLNEGSEGLAELRQEARDLGVVLDQETVKQGAEIKDNVERLQALWEGIKRRAGASIFPVLKQLTDGAIAWVKANKEVIRQKLEVVLRGVAKAVRFLIDAFDVLWGSLKLAYDVVMAVVKSALEPLMALLEAIGPTARAAAVAFAIGWALAAAPVTAIVAGVGALLLVLNSIQRFREGKDSLFGDWMKMLHDWSKPNENDPWWLKAIKDLVEYMQKALGIADKLGLVGDKAKSKQPQSTYGKVVDTTAGALERLNPLRPGFIKNFDARTEAAKERGAGFVDQLKAGFGYGDYAAEAPALPPGQGILRAPVNVHRTYNVYQAPGMNPQDVVNLIQQHEDAANEEAAAALGD